MPTSKKRINVTVSDELLERSVEAEKNFRAGKTKKLHGKLKDLWSVSIDKKYRIILKVMDEGIILLISVGLHAIYKEN